MRKVFTVKAPNGKQFQRTSSTRVYTHAVLAKSREGRDEYYMVGWCSRPDLAQRLATTTGAKGYQTSVHAAE